MKATLLKKIRQRYDYFWHIRPFTAWSNEDNRLITLDKKTSMTDNCYGAEGLINRYVENTNMNVILKFIWNDIATKHKYKKNIRNWNKQKKSLALRSSNLTIKQVISPKNVRCFKFIEQKEKKINTHITGAAYYANGGNINSTGTLTGMCTTTLSNTPYGTSYVIAQP